MWQQLSRDYPKSPNWEQFITWFADENCLNVVDYVANVNLHPGNQPAIIRHPQIIVAKNQVRWSLLKLRNNTSTYFQNFRECTSSHFIEGNPKEFIEDLCLRLDIIRFLTHSKPLRCKVKIEIFPSLKMYAALSRPPSIFEDATENNILFRSSTRQCTFLQSLRNVLI